jgi:hypothetical protein
MDNNDILYLIFPHINSNYLLNTLRFVSKKIRKEIIYYFNNQKNITINIKFANLLINSLKNKTIYVETNKRFPLENDCYVYLSEYMKFLNLENYSVYYDNLCDYEYNIDKNNFIGYNIILNHNNIIESNNTEYIIANTNIIKTKENVFIRFNKKFYIGKCGRCTNCFLNKKKCLNCICDKCICRLCERSKKYCICL